MTAVIVEFSGGSDMVDIRIGSNITLNDRGKITRTYTNSIKATIEKG